jgi:hypothetical protein
MQEKQRAMTWLKRTFLLLLLLFLGAQLFRPEKNNDTGDQPSAVSRRFPVSVQLEAIMRESCNDCHTNNTVYPWYAHIQPVGWWLADHIAEGKNHCNFDEFLEYSLPRQYHMFEEVREMIERDEMPLPSYTLIHRDAILSEESSWILLSWSDAMRDSMKSWYPADSLVRPKRPSTE